LPPRSRPGSSTSTRGCFPILTTIGSGIASSSRPPAAGYRFSFEQFVESLGIIDQHRRLARAELHWLTQDGVLRQDDGGWRVVTPLKAADVDEPLAALAAAYPHFAAETALVQTAGPQLAEVLAGRVDPIELLFPGGSNQLLEDFYTHAADLSAFNRLIRAAVSKGVEALPPRRAVRVMEVGAGTGSLTREVLSVLPPDRAEYLFTDVGPAFLSAAKTQSADFAHVDYRSFDVDRAPDEQQIPPHRYDLILATNVLHATADIEKTLANLSLNETPRRDPGTGEIEVRVAAGGVNFRDLMKALGMYPGNPVDLLWFGDDFSGVVERAGRNVDQLRVGDRVVGLAPYCFRAYVTVDRRMVFQQPKRMSFDEAATLPTAFLTADYAINRLARLRPEEKILIHAGTGAVGQAAIQIAQHLGLEIFATAGTPEKRRLLRELGVPHVMNSRTLEFADQMLEVTHGRGVDAVLNSLAGAFIPKSLSVLGSFGRFLEIGKIDVYGNTKVGLAALKNNVSYFVIDLAQLLQEKPAGGRDVLGLPRGEQPPVGGRSAAPAVSAAALGGAIGFSDRGCRGVAVRRVVCSAAIPAGGPTGCGPAADRRSRASVQSWGVVDRRRRFVGRRRLSSPGRVPEPSVRIRSASCFRSWPDVGRGCRYRSGVLELRRRTISPEDGRPNQRAVWRASAADRRRAVAAIALSGRLGVDAAVPPCRMATRPPPNRRPMARSAGRISSLSRRR